MTHHARTLTHSTAAWKLLLLNRTKHLLLRRQLRFQILQLWIWTGQQRSERQVTSAKLGCGNINTVGRNIKMSRAQETPSSTSVLMKKSLAAWKDQIQLAQAQTIQLHAATSCNWKVLPVLPWPLSLKRLSTCLFWKTIGNTSANLLQSGRQPENQTSLNIFTPWAKNQSKFLDTAPPPSLWKQFQCLQV